MTLQIRFTVQDVSDGPAPIDVLLAANADEKSAIICNTEGKITGAELRLVFDEDEAPMQIGQTVVLSGHFSRTAPPAETPTG